MRLRKRPGRRSVPGVDLIFGLAVWFSILLRPVEVTANPCPCDSAMPNGATYENIRIFPSDRDQVEPSIAAYGAGTQKLIIGAITASRAGCQENPVGHRQGTYLSSDGGMTWSGYDTLPRSWPGGVDPAAAFGPG